jgi:hypothetical protein
VSPEVLYDVFAGNGRELGHQRHKVLHEVVPLIPRPHYLSDPSDRVIYIPSHVALALA